MLPEIIEHGFTKKRGLGVMIVPCDCAIFGVHVIYKFERVTGADSQKIIEYPHYCICLWYPAFIPNVQSPYPLVIKRRLLGIFQPCLITDCYTHDIPISETQRLFVPVKSPFFDGLIMLNHHLLMDHYGPIRPIRGFMVSCQGEAHDGAVRCGHRGPRLSTHDLALPSHAAAKAVADLGRGAPECESETLEQLKGPLSGYPWFSRIYSWV